MVPEGVGVPENLGVKKPIICEGGFLDDAPPGPRAYDVSMEHAVSYLHCFLGKVTLTLEDVAKLTMLLLLENRTRWGSLVKQTIRGNEIPLH